jgi:uncharacterized membrane protein
VNSERNLLTQNIEKGEKTMTIGPLQLVFIKFDDESRTGAFSGELKAVRKTGIIRLVDLLYVYKDKDGLLRSKNVSDLAEASKAEYGLVLQGLMGIREAQKTQGDVDKITAAMSFSAGEFGLSSKHVQEIADKLPLGGSAILALFEHTWAVRLKEAILNAGGELIAQGLLSPEIMAVTGTTLQEAIDAAQKIEEEAQKSALAETAEADQKLAQSQAAAALTIAEAQRIIDEAEAQAAAKLAEAKTVSDAAIAASVRTAAEELELADQSLQKSKQEAAKNVMVGKGLAVMQVQAGREIARQEIEQGKETAEEIKSAAALEALKILMEAQFIKREAVRQAMDTLVAASMIEQTIADESYAALLSSPDQPPS